MNRADKIAERGRLTSPELRHAAGITYKQVDYWCRTGLLLSYGGGSSGIDREFDPPEVEVAALLGRLSRLGLSPSSQLAQRAAAVVRAGESGIVTDGPLTVFIA